MQVKEMLNYIEVDADSFARRAEMYYKMRPLLMTHVKEFHRKYHSLVERYDHLAGNLRKSIPLSLQSNDSDILKSDSETGLVGSDTFLGERLDSNGILGSDSETA